MAASLTLSVPFNNSQINGQIFTGLSSSRRGWIWRIKRVEWDFPNNTQFGGPMGAGYFWHSFVALASGIEALNVVPDSRVICTMNWCAWHVSGSGFVPFSGPFVWDAPAWGYDITKSRLYVGSKMNQIAGSNKNMTVRVFYRLRTVDDAYYQALVSHGR